MSSPVEQVEGSHHSHDHGSASVFARRPVLTGIAIGVVTLVPHALLPPEASLGFAAVLIALIAGRPATSSWSSTSPACSRSRACLACSNGRSCSRWPISAMRLGTSRTTIAGSCRWSRSRNGTCHGASSSMSSSARACSSSGGSKSSFDRRNVDRRGNPASKRGNSPFTARNVPRTLLLCKFQQAGQGAARPGQAASGDCGGVGPRLTFRDDSTPLKSLTPFASQRDRSTVLPTTGIRREFSDFAAAYSELKPQW